MRRPAAETNDCLGLGTFAATFAALFLDITTTFFLLLFSHVVLLYELSSELDQPLISHPPTPLSRDSSELMIPVAYFLM